MATQLCPKCKQAHSGRVCDRDDKGECPETVVLGGDQDRGKGAMEQDNQAQDGNTSMQGQLGHRDEDAALKDADADLSG